jgi:hypothetical protein
MTTLGKYSKTKLKTIFKAVSHILILGHVEPEKVKVAIHDKLIQHFFHKPFQLKELYI